MFNDALLRLCDSQAFSATGLSTNAIDLGNVTPKRQIGDGEPMAVTIQVAVAAKVSGGTETYEFQVVQSAASSLTTVTVIADMIFAASGAIIATALVAGYVLILPIPPGFPLQRYIGLNFVGANTPTITITAFLGPLLSSSLGKPAVYAKAYTISG
jgi:hypothetical protein